MLVVLIEWVVLIVLGSLWIKEYRDGCFLRFAINQQRKGYTVNVLNISELGKTEAEIEASYIEIDAAKMGFRTKWRKINDLLIVVWVDMEEQNAD